LVALVACLVTGHAMESPDGALSPNFLEQKSKLLPEDTQNFRPALNYNLPKYTPGDACGSKLNCDDCLMSQICVWLPFNNKCVGSRNPAHKAGTMQCGTWTHDILPVINDEFDDFRLFHTRKNPMDLNIAALKGGQDMFGEVVDIEMEAPVGPRAMATMGGGDVIQGLSHSAFEGQTLEHNPFGQMVPLGAKGVESPAIPAVQ